MAHFAQLDNNNIVIRVIVINNTELLINGVESESAGIAFCQSLYGPDTAWKQTSYNGNFRKNYAGTGSIYDQVNDVFYAPQPYPSWTISAPTWTWTAPEPYPTDGNKYTWDETANTWVPIPSTPG
jgi:hypothetical protein